MESMRSRRPPAVAFGTSCALHAAISSSGDTEPSSSSEDSSLAFFAFDTGVCSLTLSSTCETPIAVTAPWTAASLPPNGSLLTPQWKLSVLSPWKCNGRDGRPVICSRHGSYVCVIEEGHYSLRRFRSRIRENRSPWTPSRNGRRCCPRAPSWSRWVWTRPAPTLLRCCWPYSSAVREARSSDWISPA